MDEAINPSGNKLRLDMGIVIALEEGIPRTGAADQNQAGL